MFKVRKTPCALNKTGFEEDKEFFNCQKSVNKVYHCIPDDGKRLGEICIQYVWVQPNYCPEYNTEANSLNVVPCNVSTGSCPKEQFLSNEVYKLKSYGDELNDSIFKSTLKEKDRHKDYMTSLLSNEFVVKDADTSNYRLQHAVIKRMALIVFGTYHFDKLLELSKQEDLKGWVKEKKINCNLCERFRDMKPVLEIKQDQWRQFQEKLGKTSS